MRLRHVPALAVLLVASALGAAAAPPDVPKELKAEPGQLVRIVVKGDKVGSLRNFGDDQAFFDELAPKPGERRYVFQATRPGTYVLGFWTLGDDYGATTTITVGPAPPVPPGPDPGPGPNPPLPPAASFRVFLIYESADTLTANQRGVLYGKAVEDWLDANCTGGKAGWRRRDKDAPGADDPATAPLWAAVQPKITSVPAVAVERDGKVDIIPLADTPAKMVEILQSYKGK